MSIMSQDNGINYIKSQLGNDFVKFYIMKDIYMQNEKKRVDLKNIYKKNGLLKLSKQFSKEQINKFKAPPFLAKDLKNYNGPTFFLFFSNLKNDSLKVSILNTPYAKYSETRVEDFLIVFNKDSITNLNHWITYYE